MSGIGIAGSSWARMYRKRSTGGANHGKESYKSNRDRTICHPCPGTLMGSVVSLQPERGNRLAGMSADARSGRSEPNGQLNATSPDG